MQIVNLRKTDKQIPLYEESNFFSTVVLEIEAYNPRELFAYPCDDENDTLVQKYANAKCYGKSDNEVTCDSGSCDGHVYNTEFVSWSQAGLCSQININIKKRRNPLTPSLRASYFVSISEVYDVIVQFKCHTGRTFIRCTAYESL